MKAVAPWRELCPFEAAAQQGAATGCVGLDVLKHWFPACWSLFLLLGPSPRRLLLLYPCVCPGRDLLSPHCSRSPSHVWQASSQTLPSPMADGALGELQPVDLMELLAGVRAEVAPSVSAYQRGVVGEASPADLETALQLVYQLFVTQVHPVPAELATVMHMTREAVRAHHSPPTSATPFNAGYGGIWLQGGTQRWATPSTRRGSQREQGGASDVATR